MILELIGIILGSLVGAYIVFSIIILAVGGITRYRWSFNKILNITLTFTIIFAIFWGDYWGLSPDQTIIRYVPAIIVIYLFERRRLLTMKCPQCKERIKTNATKCKHCQSILFEQTS
ncbi:hypothetical protein KHA93_11555 [Bacillus sp. FJAT-49732]|uniref:Uncharacterized protein n=1 Tax=Lederbergia citrisecunda TaxID=2833583 RepID=A0A942TP21_9BACI|nr:hypothetical protein [Lederbergia citrisecunda]MBS4200266.1 hypothetical protein [Lederbergia citrisecunda]